MNRPKAESLFESLIVMDLLGLPQGTKYSSADMVQVI